MAIEALKRAYLFSGLDDSELEAMDAISSEVPVRAGESLIRVGEQNTALWILLSGSLIVRDSLPGGLEVDLLRLNAGDLFGEMSFVDCLPASASVVSESAGKVLKIPFEAFRDYLEENPRVHISVLEKMNLTFSQRLRAANQRIGKEFLASMGVV